MRKNFPTELLFQVFALLTSFIIVHAIYVAEIRPTADAFLKEQQARMKSNPKYLPERSIYVVLKDYEQEACFVLMLWAMAILAYKGSVIYRHQHQLDWDFIGLPEDTRISVENARGVARRIREEVPKKAQGYILPTILLSAIDRFITTASIQDTSMVVHSMCESEAERSDSELSIIRYIAWAIPSIGFIGTVRGIGEALAHANEAVQGDITGVTENLGVAFNSTLIALLISIVLMFVIHQIQLMQERLVINAERYCEGMFISRLKL